MGKKLRWLDCSGDFPRPVPDGDVDGINQYIYDVCTINQNGRRLLAVSSLNKGLHIYNPDVKGSLSLSGGIFWGVASNGFGSRLFVCDQGSDCIQMFSVDGSYLGSVAIQQYELGKPVQLCWNEATSSLIVAHEKKGKFVVSFVTLSE